MGLILFCACIDQLLRKIKFIFHFYFSLFYFFLVLDSRATGIYYFYINRLYSTVANTRALCQVTFLNIIESRSECSWWWWPLACVAAWHTWAPLTWVLEVCVSTLRVKVNQPISSGTRLLKFFHDRRQTDNSNPEIFILLAFQLEEGPNAI